MWLLLLLCFSCIQPVVLKDNRLILQGGRGPCEGYVQVYHGDSDQWGLVGTKGWGTNTDKVVCKSIKCGEPINSEDMWQPEGFIGLNQLNCRGDETDLWECENPGWKVSTAENEVVKKITCSNQIIIGLDRFPCSGSVLYSTDGFSRPGYFCGDEWGLEEKSVVCKTLKCGKPIEDVQYPSTVTQIDMKVAKCVGNVTNLWQCVKGEKRCDKPASVTCDDHEILRLKRNSSNVCFGQLEIQKNNKWTHDMSNSKSNDSSEWCRKMFCGNSGLIQQDGNLRCSDNVTIVLRDNNQNSKCYGSVYVQVNSSFHSVCMSGVNWPQKNAEVVCQELNCGRVITTGRKKVLEGIMDSVSCAGEEASLWHCKAKHNDRPFPCSTEPVIFCSGSIDVRLEDGPGRCAGRVEIFFEGEWKQVKFKKGQEWSTNNARTVCRHLGCGGGQHRQEKFSVAERRNAMTRTLNCGKEGDNITECNLDGTYQNLGEDDEVGLVCEDHRVFYLDSDSCSGLVRIQHGEKKHYLSGSNDTWHKDSAAEVCKQMHCGNLTHFSSDNVDTGSSIWHPTLPCRYKRNPLLDCGKSTSSNATDTVARVTCSGKKTITLTHGCWGNVNICVGDDCGGVCAESWTPEKSKKLCQERECGSHVLRATKEVKNFPVKFKSVHMAEAGGNLSACSFVDNDGRCDSAYVVCSGSLEPQWKSSDYCSGKVEVKYENQLRPVCEEALKEKRTQTLFCEKLGCGDAVQAIDYKTSASNAISTLTCDDSTAQHKNLTECMASVEAKPCPYHGLECSKWRKMALATGGACSGVVVVYFEGGKKASVSSQGWSSEESQKLCERLNCGDLRHNRSENPILETEFWNTTFNCTGVKKDENIWNCETKVSPSEKKQVYLECTGEPKVKLEKGCHGEVTIDGISVCDTSWIHKYSDKVCQELNYSNALSDKIDHPKPESGKKYIHVRCEEHHHKIGQCSRVKGSCSGGLVSIYCTQNVKFVPKEKCGGQIEVIYEAENGGKVCYEKELSLKHKEDICKKLDCGEPIEKPKEVKTQATSKEIEQWVTLLKCTGNEEKPQYCLSRESCAGKKPAEIYCKGYVPRVPTPPGRAQVNVLAIILGVGLFLILLIVIIVFVRVYIIRKNKSLKNFVPGFALRNDVEFDSGEFEEIHSKEMDDGRSGGIRSESELVTENDARSTSSLPYDDIDEVSEVQPLTSRPLTTEHPHDSGIQDNKLEQNTNEDGVTYEVEDPQENYDDIEADVEATQTTAEVHDSPRNAPECSTNTPPDLVLGDDDYLVPGQDE